MIEVDLPTILMVVAAVLTPLLTVIKVLWDQWQKERDRSIEQDKSRVTEYNAMRDRMQDKIDQQGAKASDAISTVTTALNAMSQALATSKDESQRRADQWEDFKDDLLSAVRQLKECA